MDLERGEVTRFEKKLTVIDTPGFSNTKLHDHDVLKKIKAYSGGYSAILLVLDISKFDENEKFISSLMLMLPSNFVNYSIVIFTHKDRLERTHPNEATSAIIARFGETSKINKLLRRAENRYVDFRHSKSFENNTQQDEQVKGILTMTNKLPKENFYFDSTVKQVISYSTVKQLISEITTNLNSITFMFDELEMDILKYQTIIFFMLQFFLLCFLFRKLSFIEIEIQNAKCKIQNANQMLKEIQQASIKENHLLD